MTEEDSKKNKPRLGRLMPRNTRDVAARSLAYSRLVGRLRWLLPMLVALALFGLWAWPKWNELDLKQQVVQSVPNLMIEKLNLSGVDTNNRTYRLTADRALQSGSLKNMIDLEHPQGEITLEDGAWVTGQAEHGRLEQATKMLWLSGAVELLHDQGYRFLTDEMDVDLKNMTAKGQKDVLFQGSFGVVRGKGFQMADAGNTIIVRGPAAAQLYLRRSGSFDKPSVNHSSSR